MTGVTATDDPTEISPGRARFDRRVLVSNLVAGALCLSPLVFVSWPLFLIGAGYVVVGSLFLSAVYARGTLSRGQEAAAWAAPWLLAVVLWTVLLAAMEFELSLLHVLAALGASLVIATPAYVVWQAVALAVRQFLAWRAGQSSRQV